VDEDDDLTYCESCRQCDREESLLLCDGCDHAYHLDCLTPALTRVPVDEWFCPQCSQRHGKYQRFINVVWGSNDYNDQYKVCFIFLSQAQCNMF